MASTTMILQQVGLLAMMTATATALLAPVPVPLTARTAISRYSGQKQQQNRMTYRHMNHDLASSTTTELDTTAAAVTTPIFDFTSDETSSEAIKSFDRIDDAIMGGISTSSLRDVKDEKYASWSGVCRVDGGGFCGFRTLPFVEPLNVTGADGVFVDCRLASDDEPERRIWKTTVRTESGYRGEQVYQAEFEIPKMEDREEWSRIQVPFDSFRLVRGPRLVPDGEPINVTAGLFQIGFTMSKFQMAANTTELVNFRPGYFELQLQRIGVFSESTSSVGSVDVKTETKREMMKNQSIMLKILRPVFKLLFSEKANRRKVAMKILKEKRGMGHLQAILFGMKLRSKNMLFSLTKTLSIVGIDAFRFSLINTMKLVLFYPLVAIRRSFVFMKKLLLAGGEDATPAVSMAEES